MACFSVALEAACGPGLWCAWFARNRKSEDHYSANCFGREGRGSALADPRVYSEHDFESFEADGETIIFKIDHYD